jgi:preprotein translocase subunit SecG
MFTFLLIVQTLVAAALVTVILMQRSEGGGLGVGGSTSGLMTARGAADFLTRATAILATLFVVLSIALAGLAAVDRAPTTIDPSLARRPAPTTPIGQPAPVPGAVNTGQVPLADDPLAGAAATAINQSAPQDQIRPTPSPAPAGNTAQ